MPQSAEVAPRAALNVPRGVQEADRETREVIRVAVRGDRPAVTAGRNGSNVSVSTATSVI